jgi:hypothetical protein
VDLIDLIWNASQERRLGDFRTEVERMRVDRDLAGWDLRKVRDLAEENDELKLRLGLLVRLLIGKGIISAEENATMIAETRPAPETHPCGPTRGLH